MAIWYPAIPSPNLCLNEIHFPQRHFYSTGYHPLFWTLFGGPGGEYLQNLTRMTATLASYLHGLEFHYNSDNVPVSCRKLGRHAYDKHPGYSKLISFAIDGPGGEVIEAVEVYLEYLTDDGADEFCKYGALESFKVGQLYQYYERIIQLCVC